jgi:hypothetical protein
VLSLLWGGSTAQVQCSGTGLGLEIMALQPHAWTLWPCFPPCVPFLQEFWWPAWDAW